jgi:hypothetical protein
MPFPKALPLIALGFSLGLTVAAQAHTPLCACYDNGDGTILCEGGFSDGSSATGVRMAVLDADGNVLIDAEMDDNSEFVFDTPEGDYSVLFDAGEGHKITVPASDIF